MDETKALDILERALADGNGILRMAPAWVARAFLPPGKRLGLKEEEYDVGERGFISERWLASTTKADNDIGPDDEGLSYIQTQGDEKLLLRDAVSAGGPKIMGEEYAETHDNQLGRLAKIYDFDCRIPYHLHQMQKDAAKVGANSKEEAYYFPEGVDMGKEADTYFGVHPHIVEQDLQEELLLPYLVDWDSDLILQHSYACRLVPGDGFHIPAGILHAPGTALTIELQEDSDVFSMLQALVNGAIISKDLLFKDVTDDDREKYGERIILDQVDWQLCGDPYFFPNRHLGPRLVEETAQDGGAEYWIYYNTTKFSGKKLVVNPGGSFECRENGVYSALVWRGEGKFAGLDVKAGDFLHDEFVVTRDVAVQPHVVENTGSEEMQVIKFFGPDINLDVPMIEPYQA